MMLVKLFASVLGGLAAHQAYRPSHELGERTGALFRNSVGGLGMLPFLLMLHDEFGEMKHDRVRLLVAYLINLGAFGTGVFIGHLLDDVK